MPYRDFYFGSPPLSIYEQAALIRLFGDLYTILASRWVFSVEVAVSTVLAYVTLLRWQTAKAAFLLTLPTCFFTVILFYFTNYSYDGEVFALLSLALLVHSSPPRWALSLVGGAAASLAFMAKPTFLILIGVTLLAAIANGAAARRAGHDAPSAAITVQSALVYLTGFGLGCLLVFAYFATAGVGADFVRKAFLVPRQTYPVSLTFVIWQDMPEWMLAPPNIAGYIAGLVVLALAIRISGIPDWLRVAAVAAVFGVLLVRAAPPAADGLPTARQDAVLLVGLGSLWVLNLAAAVFALVTPPHLRRRLFPPELGVMGLGLQYIAQYNAAGVRFSYYGTFLSIPVALLLLHRLAQLPSPPWRRGRFEIAAPTWSAIILGVSIALTGIVDAHGVVFRDGPRSQLTSSFRTPALNGIRSLPINAETVDGVVGAVESRTAPDDPIFVMPDFPALYYLTGRRNPTRIGWYESPQVSEQQANEAVADLERDPPKVIVLQSYDEGDFLRTGPPLDYMNIPQLRPIYVYIVDNYRQVDTVGDLKIYVPNSDAG
jgi:hypothetical protein